MKELYKLVLAAADLVERIAGQAAADAAAFEQAYRLGFTSGIEVGRQQLDHELTEQDRRRAEHIRNVAKTPGHAELARRRAEPGNLWRYRDGQAIEPDAFTAGLIRRGVYEGGPVDWETGRPLDSSEDVA